MLLSHTPDEVTMLIYVLERAECAVTSATLLQHCEGIHALRLELIYAYRKLFVPTMSASIDST